MKKNVIFAFLLLVSSLILNGQTYGTLTGTIKNPQGITISHAVIESKENLIRSFTDQNGNFSLRIPANREIKLTIFRDPSYLDTTITVKLAPNEEQRIDVVLPYNAVLLKPVSITKNVRDNYRILDPQLVTQVPSPTGNIVSLLKTFGGVYSPNELSSQYNVRGGNFDENLVYVNDIEIHRPFLVRNAQQEGLGFVNSDLTKSVKFSAGGFEAKYGDKMSSVLDVEYKTPAVGYRSSATLSLLGASIHTEGNVANKFTYLIGVRYKSNAYLLNSLQTKGNYKPRFFDTQMLLVWNLNSKWSINLLGNFTRNVYLFTPSSRTTNFGTIFEPQQLTVDYEGQEVDKYENYLGAMTLHFKPDMKNKYKLILSSYYAKESETYDILGQYNLADIEADLGSSSNDIINVAGISGTGSSLEHARNYITAVVSAADLRGEHKMGNHNINWGIKIQHEYVDDQLKEWTMTDSSGYSLPNNPGTPGEEVPLD
ncbi:MAG: TonB-dependent receptor plug domain-containing protein, partial [Bacteroidales bacterium]|nr:TonB-dependent receptor plug domain-containing protein [Bacteroidales bacterium]